MKRCPTCQRTFTDETLSYCLDDGTPLLDQSGSGPQSHGPNINIKPPQNQDYSAAPTVAYRPNTTPANPVNPSWQPGPAQQAQAPRKRKVWPWVLGVLGVLSLLFVGFIVLVIALASMGANSNNANTSNTNVRTISKNTNSNTSSNTNSNSNSYGVSNNSNNYNSTYSNPKAAGDVEITDINMARDTGKGEPGETVDAFSPSERTIYCVVNLSRLKPGTKVKFLWYAVQAGRMRNLLLKELEYTTASNEAAVQASLTRQDDWPTGDYRVDVTADDGPVRSIDFSVE